MTTDIKRRMSEHKKGKSNFTRGKDAKLVYYEKLENSDFKSARQRELEIKKMSQSKKLELITSR
jgi:predicted GIY-YIG superfamily endonuclease